MNLSELINFYSPWNHQKTTGIQTNVSNAENNCFFTAVLNLYLTSSIMHFFNHSKDKRTINKLTKTGKVLTSCWKSEKFHKLGKPHLKNLIWCPFWALLSQKPQNKIFFLINPTLSLFELDTILTSCKKSESFY